MYKKALIGETRFLYGKTSEDIPFNFLIFQKAKKFAYLSEKKYYYYSNPESIRNGVLNKNMMNYLLFRGEILQFYKDAGNKVLCEKAEALYARAAMGLMARMALYGVAKDLDEKEYRELFKTEFRPHARAFFNAREIAISRKVLAVMVFRFYPLVRLIRGAIK